MVMGMIKTIREDGEIQYLADNAEELLALGSANPTPDDEVYHPTPEENAKYDNTQHQRERQYPSIGEQLDMIFHAGLGGDEFQAAIQAVKDSHPKPI